MSEMVESTQIKPAWCIAANVVYKRKYGEGGIETQFGTKHFAPGAKVYPFNFFWGMGGEKVYVVGRHRGSHRFVTMAIRSKWLANWRVELVYSPHIIKRLAEQGDFCRFEDLGGAEAKAHAERIVENFQGANQPFVTRPPQQEGETSEENGE